MLLIGKVQFWISEHNNEKGSSHFERGSEEPGNTIWTGTSFGNGLGSG